MRYLIKTWLIRAVLCLLIISLAAGGITGCRKKQKNAGTQETPQTAEQTGQTDTGQEAEAPGESLNLSEEIKEAEEQKFEEPEPEETSEEAENLAEAVPEEPETVMEAVPEGPAVPDENGSYTSKDEVALYIHTYGRLPDNFITKRDAEYLGWDNREGNLDEVAPGMSIGGDRFGNYEGYLPAAKGCKYYECDVNYSGGYRGGERIVYSNDGYVFYTKDHYNTFETLYEPD